MKKHVKDFNQLLKDFERLLGINFKSIWHWGTSVKDFDDRFGEEHLHKELKMQHLIPKDHLLKKTPNEHELEHYFPDRYPLDFYERYYTLDDYAFFLAQNRLKTLKNGLLAAQIANSIVERITKRLRDLDSAIETIEQPISIPFSFRDLDLDYWDYFWDYDYKSGFSHRIAIRKDDISFCLPIERTLGSTLKNLENLDYKSFEERVSKAVDFFSENRQLLAELK